MKLYYHPASTTCRMVMMLAAEEAIDLDFELVDILAGEHLKPEYAAINPNRLVPLLDDDGFRLTESSAILRYLADKTGSSAYPRDLRKRARVDEMMDWFNNNLYKDLGYGLIYPQLFPHHKRQSEEAHAGAVAWGRDRTRHWLGILDKDLIGSGRPYVCGDSITLADYVGAEMITLGELVRCRYDAYPNIERWIGNMKALKSWPKVHEVFYGFAASVTDMPFEAI